MDLFEKIKKNPGPLGQHAKDAHGYFTFPILEGEITSRMVFNKKEAFFELHSTKITSFSGPFIAIGIPGRPPPLPRSTTT